MVIIKIGIIGAGNVGCAYAKGLIVKGFNVAGVYSKSFESFDNITKSLGLRVKNDLLLTIERSDVLILAVQDSAISGLVEKIIVKTSEVTNKIQKCDINKKIFLHCSGALTSGVLDPLRSFGAYTGSLHPIQTFADRENGWKSLDNIYFGFEGCQEALEYSKVIVKAFKGNILVIEKDQKPLYHAAACILSNYTVTLSYIAGELLCKAGINADVGIKAFLPLLKNTVENIAGIGSVNALTGPVLRGDALVVSQHIESIVDKAPEFYSIYRALTFETIILALKKAGINKDQADKLMELLGIEN